MKAELNAAIASARTREDSDDAELIIRNALEDILAEIKQWFKDNFNITTRSLSNFPTLDELIYRENGWNLHDALRDHYEVFCKTNDKEQLKAALYRIASTEGKRLRNTVFDTLNERNGAFKYVTTTGDPDCDQDTHICRQYYGTFEVAVDWYLLPPYHALCDCYAIYHDNKELD